MESSDFIGNIDKPVSIIHLILKLYEPLNISSIKNPENCIKNRIEYYKINSKQFCLWRIPKSIDKIIKLSNKISIIKPRVCSGNTN